MEFQVENDMFSEFFVGGGRSEMLVDGLGTNLCPVQIDVNSFSTFFKAF